MRAPADTQGARARVRQACLGQERAQGDETARPVLHDPLEEPVEVLQLIQGHVRRHRAQPAAQTFSRGPSLHETGHGRDRVQGCRRQDVPGPRLRYGQQGDRLLGPLTAP